ncbi:hypothetical protein DUNSADRAFT_7342 [Dunaliella salina]|uniref:Small ribosomal subunit protein uS15c n=2 Tax=Dunaliella salina TaxID=3046 RepID=A0ABQ7GLG5_DUNSA|nr:hypothetical protein DUNSADRAFT_7342 [Dunaliella salina]|eukprot:KAF5835454.1 hypothetical protein DUNSADRAFT_7342 [Dunaliella salina]
MARREANVVFGRNCSQLSTSEPPEQTSVPSKAEKKPDLVDKVLSRHNMSRSGSFQSVKMELARDFQRHPGDVGSPEVVVALWTHWIRSRVDHYQALPRHTKAVHTLRHLELVVNKRRRLLAYLRRSSPPAYALCIQRLGLGDVFGEAHEGDRYPVGYLHGDPAGASDEQRRRRFAFHRKYRVKKTQKWKRMLPHLQREDPQLIEPAAPKAGAPSQYS